MNNKSDIPLRNIIDLFRNYYKLDIHHFVGISAHAIMTGLLYKFNELHFPDELKISVKEILSLSGISDIRTLRNARKILTGYLHEEENKNSWILKYQENTIKEYGIYMINYVYLLESSCNITVNLLESSSKKDGLSTKIAPDLLPKSAKNALPSNTIPDHTIRNDKNISLSPTSLIVIDDPIDEFENKSESEIQNFQKGKKLIEEQYKQFFVNNQSRGLSEEQRNMICTIGSFPEDNARTVLKEKASNSRSPFNAIKWTAEQLQNGNGGNGKHAEKKRSQIDAVREIWNDDDRLQNRIAMKSWTDKEAVKLSLARIAELHEKTLEEVFIGFERECDYYKIDKDELLDYSIERI